MGNMEDALKKAGLGEEGAAEEQAPAAEGSADTGAPPVEASHEPAAETTAETTAEPPAAPAAEPAAQAAVAAEAPVEAKEQPCAQCGTPFMAKHPRHRMCDKCAAERQSARLQAKPAPRSEAKPAPDRGPAPSGETRACARCGTVFSPKHPRHRMCDKCAAEAPPREPREPRPPRESRPAGEARPLRESRPAPEAPRAAAPPVARPIRRDPPPTPLRRSPAPSAGVPHDYLAGGYFSGGTRSQLRDELYLDWAQQWAELLVQRRLSSAQLRAFYNHVRRAAASLQAGGDAQQARTQLLRIPGFAAARVGRPGFPLEFREFLDRNVEQVKDAATVQAFAEHFQAVVGYTSGRLRN